MASNQSVSVDTHELNQQLEAWRTRHTELRTKNNELTMLNNELTINNNELRNKNTELMKKNFELRRQLRNEQKAQSIIWITFIIISSSQQPAYVRYYVPDRTEEQIQLEQRHAQQQHQRPVGYNQADSSCQ